MPSLSPLETFEEILQSCMTSLVSEKRGRVDMEDDRHSRSLSAHKRSHDSDAQSDYYKTAAAMVRHHSLSFNSEP